jgi:hypothetical protein
MWYISGVGYGVEIIKRFALQEGGFGKGFMSCGREYRK